MTVEAGRFEEPLPDQRRRLLQYKLMEEVSEYLVDEDRSELADVMEVCFALAEDHGWPPRTFIDYSKLKMETRGDLRAPGVLWIVGE